MPLEDLAIENGHCFSLKENNEKLTKLSHEEQECVNNFRVWILYETEFYGRTDEDFLLLYLRACKFNVEKAKKKLTLNYELKKKFPKWSGDRDVTSPSIQSLIQLHVNTAMPDRDPTKPAVLFTKLSRIGPNIGNFDDYMKLQNIVIEIVIRRPNCRMNGFVWIIDTQNHPMWPITKIISPTFVKMFINLGLSNPVRIKKVVVLNVSFIANTFFRLVNPFLTQKLQERLIVYRSNWSTISDHVELDLIPDEYGGTAGPLSIHQENFVNEILSNKDYILDDDKYGFQ